MLLMLNKVGYCYNYFSFGRERKTITKDITRSIIESRSIFPQMNLAAHGWLKNHAVDIFLCPGACIGEDELLLVDSPADF